MYETQLDKIIKKLKLEKAREEPDLLYLEGLTPFEVYEELLVEESIKVFSLKKRRSNED
jgi:hypothetical protein